LTNEEFGRRPTRPIFLHNLGSGPVFLKWQHRKIVNLFRALYPEGFYVPIDRTNPGQSQQQFQKAILSGCDYIYVGGGDGTLNRLLPDLLSAKLPVGVLPIGTGNLFARYVLGIQSSSDLLKKPEKYKTKAFYPGLSDNRPFVLMVGTGLDGEAIHHQSNREKYWLGKVSYPLEMFFALIRYKMPELFIRYEDTKGIVQEKTALWAIISRSPSYFPPFTVNPGWDPWQKALSVTLIHGRSKKDLWISLIEILMGKIPSKRTTFEKTRSVQIRGNGRAQADGEEIPLPELMRVSEKPIFFSTNS